MTGKLLIKNRKQEILFSGEWSDDGFVVDGKTYRTHDPYEVAAQLGLVRYLPNSVDPQFVIRQALS
jgi:hypothetical protein